MFREDGVADSPAALQRIGAKVPDRKKREGNAMAASAITEISGPVLRIRLARAEEGNPLDDGAVESLRQALDLAARDPEVRVVVLEASGPVFSEGSPVPGPDGSGEEPPGDGETVRSARRRARLLLEIGRLPKPVVARVQGRAAGEGAALAAACDVVVASTTARFSLAGSDREALSAIALPCFIRRMGPARTREILLLGREIDGAEAAAIGLVTRAVDPTLLEAAVGRVVSELLRGSPEAQAQAKQAFLEAVPWPAPVLPAPSDEGAGLAASIGGISLFRTGLPEPEGPVRTSAGAASVRRAVEGRLRPSRPGGSQE